MAMSNRCFAKAVIGLLESALLDCDQAIDLHPNRLGTFETRGFVYLKMNRPDQAIEDYNRVLTKRSDDPYARYGRAIAERTKGNLRASDEDAVRALSIKPDIAEYMANIGVSLGNAAGQKE
jgi:tetratricopeptide (TPR) repeat protein